MKKLFLTACVALASLTVSAQTASDYIVKTSGVKKVVATDQAGDASMAQQEESSLDFIGQNFKFYSLCDWKEGMKFMVLPEKYDLVVKTFTDAATGKEVSSMPLKYKIMVYKGHNESSDGHSRINFHCLDNGKMYYYEIPNGSFDDYCYSKTGVPTLAYLDDVDSARVKLIGKTVYTKTQFYRVDTEVDGEGFQDVVVDKAKPVKVVKVGVGTRSFPVKIIVEDEDGNQFYQNVAISKTNSGMRDDEFIMDNTKYLFSGSFELVDDIMAVNGYNYKVYYNRIIHTKFPTKMRNEVTNKMQSIPRMAEYQIMEITPHKNDDKATIKLKNTTLGTFFYIDMVLDQPKAEDQKDYFGYLFAPGPGKQVQTTEGSRAQIRSGHVGIGFTEDEVEMAAGEADKKVDGENGTYTWVYNRSNNMLLYVDFDGSRHVTKTYTKQAPGAAKKKATTRKRTGSVRRSASYNWQKNKGTPL